MLVPLDHQISQDNAITPEGTIQLNKNIFEAYMFTVHSNLKRETIVNGMALSDIQHGLNIGNYGVTLLHHSSSCSACYTQLVTWRKVLHEHNDRLQVWEHQSNFRNLSESFKKCQTTEIQIIIINTRGVANYTSQQCIHTIDWLDGRV